MYTERKEQEKNTLPKSSVKLAEIPRKFIIGKLSIRGLGFHR